MKAVNFNRKEMEQESRRIYRNLSRRIKTIQSQETPVAEYAINAFRELQENYPRKLADMTDKQLREYYRDLRYISGLKSSTVKGAKFTAERFDPIKKMLGYLSKKTQDKFWQIYGKLYENNALLEKFKYDIFDVSMSKVYGGEDVEETVQRIWNRYNEILEDNPNDEQTLNIQFTEALKDLLYDF